jgi:DNA-directed RNA polymerase subunit RPC12/RpoP
MDISFQCDRCGQNIVIDESGAGAPVNCPKCGSRVTAPAKQQPTPLEMSFPEAELPELMAPPELKRMLNVVSEPYERVVYCWNSTLSASLSVAWLLSFCSSTRRLLRTATQAARISLTPDRSS